VADEKLVYDGLQRCPYLPGRVARMPLYRQERRLTLDEADQRFASSERRVGRALYRVQCPSCDECKGIRVPVAAFRPSRSQRRVLRRWKGRVRVEISPVSWSEDKLELFQRHKRERGLVEEGEQPMGAIGYVSWLVQTCMHTAEMRYYLADRLVGVGILDLGRTSVSSVYFYFDPTPEVARLSPGVFSALTEIAFCRRTGREHYYLGLYIADCSHMNYKASYRPHELYVDGEWQPVGEGPLDDG